MEVRLQQCLEGRPEPSQQQGDGGQADEVRLLKNSNVLLSLWRTSTFVEKILRSLIRSRVHTHRLPLTTRWSFSSSEALKGPDLVPEDAPHKGGCSSATASLWVGQLLVELSSRLGPRVVLLVDLLLLLPVWN